MEFIQQSFSVAFNYKVFFTEHLFNGENTVFIDFLKEGSQAGTAVKKILFIIDEGVEKSNPELKAQITAYFSDQDFIQLVPEMLVVPGGEAAKNTEAYLNQIVETVNVHGIDRHSYIAAIGGGAVLDLAGYASAISHRGIKHIRIPTTVLSQNDSGVGVKNGINYRFKKNFLGTFAPPVAVFNDFEFLKSLSDRDWRTGISEAIKVALIKDEAFFYWLEENAETLAGRNMEAMKHLVKRCAELHMQHISGGDPFEMGSSRPLDFGHWSAHKLEQLSNFEVLHGEAVAIGIALDTMYSTLSGRLSAESAQRIIHVLLKMGLPVTHPLLYEESQPLLIGLQEFREHLGGELTIMLLASIGKGVEVHEMDSGLVKESANRLKDYGVAEGTIL